MKNYILILFFTATINAQITGRILSDGYPDVVVQAKISQIVDENIYNLEGHFSIQFPKNSDHFDLLIETANINFKIENITADFKTLSLGDIDIPYLKNISIEQYNGLQEKVKINYVPTYHYANLLGYCDKLTLSSNYITFYCKGNKQQTNQFTFNPTEMLISIDAKNLIRCDN